MKKIIIVSFLLIVGGVLMMCLTESCGVAKVKSKSTAVSHAIWDGLLKKYVAQDGSVDYEGFRKDRVVLDSYLNLLKKNHPNDKNWTRAERLVYWINAYNAFTIDLVARNYPTKSIKDIKSGIPFINSVWDIKFIEIEGKKYDLNNIEHSILRRRFDEPRIHFAINCASISCPRLRNEAYTVDKIESQLQEMGIEFLNDKTKNDITPKKAKLSKIFKWFKSDFVKKMSRREYLNQFLEDDKKMKSTVDVSFLEYDWGINDAK